MRIPYSGQRHTFHWLRKPITRNWTPWMKYFDQEKLDGPKLSLGYESHCIIKTCLPNWPNICNSLLFAITTDINLDQERLNLIVLSKSDGRELYVILGISFILLWVWKLAVHFLWINYQLLPIHQHKMTCCAQCK